jgi:hypothetical protein
MTFELITTAEIISSTCPLLLVPGSRKDNLYLDLNSISNYTVIGIMGISSLKYNAVLMKGVNIGLITVVSTIGAGRA